LSTERVDFLFRGSHPAFFWAAALLKQKGLSVAILPEPAVHSWEYFPQSVVDALGIADLKSDRDIHPIQILTSQSRFGIYNDLDLTEKDFAFSVGDQVSSEAKRGLSFFAKGSDYPAVYGESAADLMKACHDMVYFEKSPNEIQSRVIIQLKQMGVQVLMDSNDLPIAEQTVVLDLSRAKLLRTKFEIVFPLHALPVGASSRMLFVERNSPLIEMIYRDGAIHLRTLLPEQDFLIERMITTVSQYLGGHEVDLSEVRTVLRGPAHEEWVESQSNVDASRMGTWLISPALNPELGERSLYVRLSDLIQKKFKKSQIFENQELFLA
jgi:hypothetical protein